MSQHVGLFRAVPFLLHSRRLVIKTVFLGWHQEGEQSVDDGAVAEAFAPVSRALLPCGRQAEDTFVEGSPVIDFHVVQAESRRVRGGTNRFNIAFKFLFKFRQLVECDLLFDDAVYLIERPAVLAFLHQEA